MDKFLDIKVKNHKRLNKKILFVEYLKKDFTIDLPLIKEIINYYISKIKEHDNLIILADFRNIETFDKKSVWEGVGELKINDEFFVKHVTKAFIITDNLIINSLINIILKVMKNNIPTILVKNINEALEKLN